LYCVICDVSVSESVECDDDWRVKVFSKPDRELRRAQHRDLVEFFLGKVRTGFYDSTPPARMRRELSKGLPSLFRLSAITEAYAAELGQKPKLSEPGFNEDVWLNDVEGELAHAWGRWARRFAEHGMLDQAIAAQSRIVACCPDQQDQAHLELAALFARKADAPTRIAHFDAAVSRMREASQRSAYLLRRYVDRVCDDYEARVTLAEHLLWTGESTCGMQEFVALERELDRLGRPDPWRTAARAILQFDPKRAEIRAKLKQEKQPSSDFTNVSVARP